jgi:hypothetical protein
MTLKALVTLEHGLLDLESRGKLQRPSHRLNKLLANGMENLEAKLSAHMDLVARADEALASRAVAELRRDADGLGAGLRQLERRDPSGVARLLGIQHTIALEAEVLAARKPASLVQAVGNVVAARAALDAKRKERLSDFRVHIDSLVVEAKQGLSQAVAEAERLAGLRADELAEAKESRTQAQARMREHARRIDLLPERLASALATGRAVCRKREEAHSAVIGVASRRMSEEHKALRRVSGGTDELIAAREAFQRGRRALRRALLEYTIGCNVRAAEASAAAQQCVVDVRAAAEDMKQEQRRQMECALALASAVEELRDCLPPIS